MATHTARRWPAFALLALITSLAAPAAPSMASAGTLKEPARVSVRQHALRHYGGVLRSLGAHGTPTRQALRQMALSLSSASARGASATAAPTNVQYLGGPVMSNVVVYNIF